MNQDEARARRKAARKRDLLAAARRVERHMPSALTPDMQEALIAAEAVEGSHAAPRPKRKNPNPESKGYSERALKEAKLAKPRYRSIFDHED